MINPLVANGLLTMGRELIDQFAAPQRAEQAHSRHFSTLLNRAQAPDAVTEAGPILQRYQIHSLDQLDSVVTALRQALAKESPEAEAFAARHGSYTVERDPLGKMALTAQDGARLPLHGGGDAPQIANQIRALEAYREVVAPTHV